jgi:hypothetical protein
MRIPKIVIPILVVVLFAGGYLFQRVFFFPTTEVTYASQGDSRVEFIVDGLKCRGTASFFTEMFNDVPGIRSITTYAADHRAIFVYNSEEINPDRIKVIFEKEFRLDDGSFTSFYQELERREF